jgi:hypothetical protein
MCTVAARLHSVFSQKRGKVGDAWASVLLDLADWASKQPAGSGIVPPCKNTLISTLNRLMDAVRRHAIASNRQPAGSTGSGVAPAAVVIAGVPPAAIPDLEWLIIERDRSEEKSARSVASLLLVTCRAATESVPCVHDISGAEQKAAAAALTAKLSTATGVMTGSEKANQHQNARRHEDSKLKVLFGTEMITCGGRPTRTAKSRRLQLFTFGTAFENRARFQSRGFPTESEWVWVGHV